MSPSSTTRSLTSWAPSRARSSRAAWWVVAGRSRNNPVAAEQEAAGADPGDRRATRVEFANPLRQHALFELGTHADRLVATGPAATRHDQQVQLFRNQIVRQDPHPV